VLVNGAAPTAATSDISMHYPIINSVTTGVTVSPGDSGFLKGASP
jgi:hypothetical protein